jgi:integrase
MFSRNSNPVHWLEIDQIARLLAAAKTIDEIHWLAMAVAFNHHLRSNEVVAITPSCIAEGQLVMERSKKSNMVDDELVTHANPLFDERDSVIRLALKNARFNQRLFPICTRTFQRWVNAAGALAGLPKLHCHPHILKHSSLRYLRRNGVDLDELQPRSGHKSLDSLKVYEGFSAREAAPVISAALAKIDSTLGLDFLN